MQPDIYGFTIINKGDVSMDSQKHDQQGLFKDLLVKVYEKGEKEKNLSTRDVVRDLEHELREILASK